MVGSRKYSIAAFALNLSLLHYFFADGRSIGERSPPGPTGLPPTRRRCPAAPFCTRPLESCPTIRTWRLSVWREPQTPR